MRGRILLQDLLSHCYLGEKGKWTTSCQQARVFEHTYLALLEGLEYPEHMQVVWCFRNPSQNMYMLVRPDEKLDVFPCEKCALLVEPERARDPGPGTVACVNS